MKSLNNNIILLMLLLPSFCFGQDSFEGQVINKTTELPILGVTVRLLKGKIATQTNERGYYTLSNDEPKPNDSLQYSYVGYKTLRLAVSAYVPQMFIALEPNAIQLAEVRIANTKTQMITLSKFSAYDLKRIVSNFGYKGIYFVTSTTTIAKLFEVPQQNGILMSLALGRQDHPMSPTSATQNKLAKFILKLYTQNPFTKAPESVFFKRNIVNRQRTVGQYRSE
ncbi:carboxypeptidase-like regulatory domain-containing protein [Mucilaginibacter antarcticus]|uniref:carboxypeptidase-like regulatory domain-containing protein n=1 Tax=Mucilaginibacter antarcticus TaxID=1855725 RepID=UPI00363C4DED